MNSLLFTLLIGIGATGVMDAWSFLRKLLFGIPTPNYGMLGRWIGHMKHGQFHHNAIATSSRVSGEQAIGWITHYLTGIVFAALLVAIWGNGWIQTPTIAPALLIGITTVAAPFLIMQPGMGAGIAASKTKNPNAARLQSLITHTVFGFGLYVSANAIQLVY